MPKKHRGTERRTRGREVRMYPVYANKPLNSDSVLGERPLCQIDWATRERWMADGAIVSVCRGKAVRLLVNLPPTPQRSNSMGPDVLNCIIDKLPYALHCQTAWQPANRVIPVWREYGAAA